MVTPQESDNTLSRPELDAILGFDSLGVPDMRHGHDERQYILETTLNATIAMRTRMLGASAAAGMRVSDEEYFGWRPNAPQIKSLNRELASLRRRARMLEGLEEYVSDSFAIEGLRPHQLDALNDTVDFVRFMQHTDDKGGKSGYLDMPTGTGKTATFAHIARGLKSKETAEERVRTLVIVPTVQLLQQTIGDEVRGFKRFAPDLELGVHYQDKKTLNGHMDVMTKDSFNLLFEEGVIPDYDAVIYDESHTGLGPNISQNLKAYIEGKIAIGCSATPDYDDERRTDTVFEHQIYSMDLRDAIKGGLLAPAHAFVEELDYEIDYDSLPEDPNERRIAVKKAVMEAKLLHAMPYIIEGIEAGKGVVLRCGPGDDIYFARRAAQILRQYEVLKGDDTDETRKIIAVEVGGSQQSLVHYQLIIDKFNAGEIDAISNVKLLGMGADLPRAKVGINLASSSSKVEMIQWVGRFLRMQYDSNGDPVEAVLIDFDDPNMLAQVTPVDVLKEGNNVAVEAHVVAEVDDNEPSELIDFSLVPEAELVVVAEDTQEQYALGHDEGVEAVAAVEITKLRHDKIIGFDGVCQWFGIGPRELKLILSQIGSSRSDELTVGDAVVIGSLFPEIDMPTLPDSGYISLSVAKAKLNYTGNLRKFRQSLTRSGVVISKFRRQGVAGEYISTSYLE